MPDPCLMQGQSRSSRGGGATLPHPFVIERGHHGKTSTQTKEAGNQSQA